MKNIFEQLQREVPQAQNWRIISGYQKNPSLKDLLVRANFKRSRRPTRTHHLPFIWSTNNNKHWTISQRITGKHENIIYVIWCKKCRLQYVGETGNTLPKRLSAHRANIKYNLKKRKPP